MKVHFFLGVDVPLQTDIALCTFKVHIIGNGNFFCQKKIYRLNLQAICNIFKQFLWCATGNKGSCHDSTAFQDTRLFELLVGSSKELYETGLFLIGDLAYPLLSFLMTLYSNVSPEADPHGIHDGFNYYESLDWIWIECVPLVSELIMCWGIF
jgi:hypothetical protein